MAVPLRFSGDKDVAAHQRRGWEWNPYLKASDKASHRQALGAQHRLDGRCLVAQETFRLAQRYRSAVHGEFIQGPFGPGPPALFGETSIEVTTEESLDAAHRLGELYANEFSQRRQRACAIAVFNAANDKMSSAEVSLAFAVDNPSELELCRRSTLVSELADVEYPLAGRILYSPDVTVFRTNRAGCYGVLPKENALHVAVVSASPVVPGEGGFEEFRKCINDILGHCSKCGHRWVVIPAWGCGPGFPYTATEVVDLFNEFIGGQEFRGKFRHVIFAIPPMEIPGT